MAVPFKIEFLDHVALNVEDLSVSKQWYEEVLGLTPYRLPEWGDYPIFMLSGKTGIALFPAKKGKRKDHNSHGRPGIDHFAFQVSKEEFGASKSWFKNQGIFFEEQDHHYFRSIYLKDPDGHTVELTTLVVKESEFYRY